MKRLIILLEITPIVVLFTACATVTAPAPEKTRASPKVQGDVMEVIQVLEAGSGERCERKVVDTEVVKRATVADYAAVERWTIDRCGKPVRYLVTFKPGPSGGVDFTVKAEP